MNLLTTSRSPFTSVGRIDGPSTIYNSTIKYRIKNARTTAMSIDIIQSFISSPNLVLLTAFLLLG
jgi:hypothetical protein